MHHVITLELLIRLLIGQKFKAAILFRQISNTASDWPRATFNDMYCTLIGNCPDERPLLLV